MNQTTQTTQITQTARPMIEMRPPILSSRFSTDTWKENDAYRARRNSDGCIYGSPLRISSKIHINAFAYVLEMNNSTNRIEGVGVIRNYPNVEQPPWIYDNNNYNRYIYEGKYRMDREAIVRYDVDLVETIEVACFKGKTHLKRGSGLTLVPKKLLIHRHGADNPDTNIASDLQTVFRKHFRGAVDNSDLDITRTV
jgi:hypothetical protein